MADTPVDCPVTMPDDLATGVYSNAFRILKDTGDDYFLDFLSYSAADRRAQVVARVRVHRNFLAAVRGRLDRVMTELKPAETGPKTVTIIPPGSDEIN